MAAAALVVSIVAVLFSAFGLYYTHRATRISEATERRARTPRLAITPEDGSEGAVSVFYGLRNDGPQDLDSVVIYRPRPPDRLEYHLAHVGQNWADDEIDLGPLKMAEETRFQFGCGTAIPWPDFRIRIAARSGRDAWILVELLPEPQRGLGVY